MAHFALQNPINREVSLFEENMSQFKVSWSDQEICKRSFFDKENVVILSYIDMISKNTV